MKSVVMRGSVVAAVASIFVLGAGVTAPALAQQIPALAANPELAAKGVWAPGTTYAVDDIVISRGSTWRSKRNANVNRIPGQTQPSSAIYWELFARGFNPTGAWVNTTKYQPDDLVTHQVQTWRAKRTILAGSAAPVAGANWELLAAKGATGPQGPAGSNSAGNGSASAPSFNFAASSSTGMFSPAAGKLALSEAGVVVLHNQGEEITALGPNALASNTIGFQNVGVGAEALRFNTSGGENTAVGARALRANTSGSDNTAVGAGALALNTASVGNTAVGADALKSNTAHENTAIGVESLRSNTTGIHNSAVGAFTLWLNNTGGNNTAFGREALLVNTTAGSNTAVGAFALKDNTGANNTAMGARALSNNTTATGNTAIGIDALDLNTTGSNNIAIGAAAGGLATGPSNSIFIGNQGASGDSLTIRIGTQGTQTTAFMAGVAGVQVGDAPVYVDSITGQLGVGIAPSSRRFKHDIETMADVSALLTKLRPVTFRYNQAKSDGSHPLQYGLIAEEVAELNPDLAMFDKEGQPNGVKYHLLPSFLLAGYQAQQNTIAAQAQEIARLKERVAANEALEERLRRLEALLPQVKAAALQ